MIRDEIKAKRSANAATRKAFMATQKPNPALKPKKLAPGQSLTKDRRVSTTPAPKLLTPEERAALVQTELTKPQKSCC